MNDSLKIDASLLLNFHGQREKLFNELHTRPFPMIETPARISQLTVLHAKDAQDSAQTRAAEFQHIINLCERYSVNPPSEDAIFYYQDFDGFEFRWERHTEFSTYTFIHHLDTGRFVRTGLSLLPPEWVAELPGQVISGFHIEIEHPPEDIDAEVLRNDFDGYRLLSSYVNNEQAQIWTSYRIHKDNMGRFLVFNNGLTPGQTGRLVRRILELETYRMMALLAFPIAKEIAPDIRKMNLQLSDIIQEINQIKDLDDERRLLEQLTTLSASIEHVTSETKYRFSATEAYFKLVKSRLEELDEIEANGRQTLSEFLIRRLAPAVETCATIESDLEDLSLRIDRASELLRTRMNLTIESQNQHLLQSMNRRGKLQLRMQQAVEGLSVAAISYYTVGLIKYLAVTAKSMGYIKDSDLITGISVPVVVVSVMFGLSRMKRKLVKHNEHLKEKDQLA